MRRDRIRLSRRHQGWIYATFGVLLVTGVLWLIDRSWPGGHEFGAETSPLGPWAMKAHGAAAMVFLVLLGGLLEGHVRQAWSARRSRLTGGGMLTGAALLVVSGYGLYYLGGETTREVTSIVHWAVGLALPVLLVGHVRAGRRVGVRRSHGRRASGRGAGSPQERSFRNQPRFSMQSRKIRRTSPP